MIIHKKIKQYDNNYCSYNNQIFSIEKIFKRYNNDDIVYTFQDFLKDFGDKYKNYVEIKTVFNILLKGASPSSYLTSTFNNSCV